MENHEAETPTHAGLFLLRLGIGLIFLAHGIPKLMAGPELWARLGMAMGNLGITFAPAFWGLMAALAEAGGGLLLVLGLGVRIAAGFLSFTMLVAVLMHVGKGDGFQVYSHALSMLVVFVSLAATGGGRWALGARWPALAGRWFQ